MSAVHGEKIPNHKLNVKFCDDSVTESEFLTTAWGNLQAREAFHKMCKIGQENYGVFATYPHVEAVSIVMVDPTTMLTSSMAEEQYRCPCRDAKEMSAHG